MVHLRRAASEGERRRRQRCLALAQPIVCVGRARDASRWPWWLQEPCGRGIASGSAAGPTSSESPRGAQGRHKCHPPVVVQREVGDHSTSSGLSVDHRELWRLSRRRAVEVLWHLARCRRLQTEETVRAGWRGRRGGCAERSARAAGCAQCAWRSLRKVMLPLHVA